ncbi:MAG: alpha/beta hydrolase [Bacillota bacterium]
MEKLFIKNRKGKKLSVLVEIAEDQKGLVFGMHGLGGFKEQEHIQTFTDAFRECGFTTVRFDAANTLGESEGVYEDAAITNYYEDLEDVIAWAKSQSWYQEPFALTGHSLGGICTTLYAERHPREVLALAPISPVVSGKLSVEAHERFEPEEFAEWKKSGWRVTESKSKPGNMKRLPWSHMEDRLKYDLVPDARTLTMPVLLIVGEADDTTPADHVKLLFDIIPGPKEFHAIKNAPHTFRRSEHLAEIRTIFLKWIESWSPKAE